MPTYKKKLNNESRQDFSTGQSVPFSKYKSTFLEEKGPFLEEKGPLLEQKSMKKGPFSQEGPFFGPFFASKRYFETTIFHFQKGSSPVYIKNRFTRDML